MMQHLPSAFLFVCGVLLAFPSDAASQFAPAFSGDSLALESEFVNSALERIVHSHAQEEGTLTAALIASGASVLALTTESQSLARDSLYAVQELGRKRRLADEARARWASKFGSDLRVYSVLEDSFRVRQKAFAEAEAALAETIRRQSEVRAQLAIAHQAHAEAEAALSAAQSENADDRAEIEQAVNQWVLAMAPTANAPEAAEVRWAQLTNTITRIAGDNEVLATVTFRSEPNTRVTLLYQTVYERCRGRPAHMLSNPTTTVHPLPIGNYHVWYESNGVARSDPNRIFTIITELFALTVEVEEDDKVKFAPPGCRPR
jgi:hypothetical protein